MTAFRGLAIAFLSLVIVGPAFLVGSRSEDLLALWLAATSLAQGHPDMVYAGSTEAFRLQIPDAWRAMALELDRTSALFPYLYPPLWASLLAPVTEAISWPLFERLATVLNVLLLFGCSVLGWRIVNRPLSAVAFLLVGQFMIYGTHVGIAALNQNQPQILVAFLTLLAIERSRADAQVSAGTALALATAIKIYPVFYAPILLARGQTRAFAAFLGVGAALASLSLALAGWPLHAEFLGLLGGISRSAVSTAVAFGIDTNIALLLPQETREAATIFGLDGRNGSMMIAQKGPFWILAGRFMLIATLGWTLLMARRADPDRFFGAIFPGAMIALSLLSPLSWSYHFIAPVALSPVLLARHGTAKGAAFLFLVALPISIAFRHAVSSAAPPGMLDRLSSVQPALGLLSMSILLGAFLMPDLSAPRILSPGRSADPA